MRCLTPSVDCQYGVLKRGFSWGSSSVARLNDCHRRPGELPQYLSLDDVCHRSFFAGEKKETLELIIINSLKEKEEEQAKVKTETPDSILLSELPNPIAEMQPGPTVVHKEVG